MKVFKSMPKVSIIIPVFNTKDYLSKCITSCINQTFIDIEIIIIDDKSTDESLEIIESFFYDKRIRLIKNKNNLGTFLARAEGIKAANSEYIFFLDSDDYLLPDTIEVLLAISDDADIIHFGIIHSPERRFATLPKIYTDKLIDENIVYQIIIKNFKRSWLTLCGRMYKTDLVKKSLQKLSFINRHLISSEDTILFFVICLLAKKSVGIPKNLYVYCENANSITRVKNEEKLHKQIDDREYLKDVLEKLQDDLELRGHRYFIPAKQYISNMLNYFICFSKKFLNKDLNDIIHPYIKYSIASMKYISRWQTMVKVMIYIFSFGNKKL